MSGNRKPGHNSISNNSSSSGSSGNSGSSSKSKLNNHHGDLSTDESCTPLEVRLLEDTRKVGAVTRLPALSKKNADTFPCVQFYLPTIEAVRRRDEVALQEWEESMKIYRKDLIWLLKLPHYKFWSFLIFSKSVAEPLLSSFLLRALRTYDSNFKEYEADPLIWPVFCDTYSLVFRVFLRTCVYKESKTDFITPAEWGTWLVKHNILDISKILDLCALYGGEGGKDKEKELGKMLENVFKYQPQLSEQFRAIIPVFISKLSEPEHIFGDHIREMMLTGSVEEQFLEDLLAFQIDSLASMYSLVSCHRATATLLHRHKQFESRLAAAYGSVVQLFGGVLALVPNQNLRKRFLFYRQLALKLFRKVLTESTIYSAGANTNTCDEFLDCFNSCVDEKVFMYDYTKAYPFLEDITYMADRGFAVDETRVEYLMNALSEYWREFGEERAPEFKGKQKPKPVKTIKIDPLDDPDFDRQLLGACSLDITGVEFDSLVTTVKDLFSDLSTRYVEACLKHYGYNTESVINAILESSVPAHLDIYKGEALVEDDPKASQETFHKGKWKDFRSGPELVVDRNRSELKTKILESLTLPTQSLSHVGMNGVGKDAAVNGSSLNTYVDESLLPSYNEENEYEDEYDDTYDEVAVGSTEPESWLYNPLNTKADEIEADRKGGDRSSSEEEDSSKSTESQRKKFEEFVEDPALVRERNERRRAEKMHQQKRNFVPDKPRDLVGKPKGQGQDKDVVLNRKHKEVHSNQNRRRGADRKRREF